jgi:uncharacterized integral membrane protein
MNFLFLLLLVVFLVFGFVVAAFNITPHVTVNLLVREYVDVPLGTVMIGAMIVGMAMASVLGLFEVFRLRMQCRKLRRRLRSLEEGAPRYPAPSPPPLSDEDTLIDAGGPEPPHLS